MGGFNSPNIMFLNTYDSLDRRYIAEIVPKLKHAGYDRYVELYAGGFAMPIIVANSGISPDNIYCYDISLYSNVLGYTFSGKDLRELNVQKDGQLIELTDEDPIINAANILYEQALARLEGPQIMYLKYLVEDLKDNKSKHIDAIVSRIRKMDSVLHGIHFDTSYIWEAFDKEKESENTFVISNPPTYKGAYEKFFDTKGRITWAGDSIEYEIWDGSIHCKQLMEKAVDAKPLVFLLQQADKGNAATENPICARYLSFTQNVYYNSNRPDEVIGINGKKETTLNDAKLLKSKFMIMPSDYEIKANSKINVFVEENPVAEYYRRIWLHRITGKSVSVHLCVVIDGYLMGFIGLSFAMIINPYSKDIKDNNIILIYAVPAPNTVYRNARLLVHIAKSKKILISALSRSKKNMQSIMYGTIANELFTVEYSRYHEVKGLRGLMKLSGKVKQNNGVNALRYTAELNQKTADECLQDFIETEIKYKDNGKQRKNS